MDNNLRRTKVIWSADSQRLSDGDLSASIEHCPYDALRIMYHPQSLEGIVSFLKKWNQRVAESGGRRFTLMVDVGSIERATVVRFGAGETGESVDFAYGEQFELGFFTKGSKAKLFIESEESLPSLFKQNENVFFSYGHIICKVLSVDEQAVKLEVAKGGHVSLGCDVQVPATKEVPSIFDLSYINLAQLQELGVDYVVFPGRIATRELGVAVKKLESQKGARTRVIIRLDHVDAWKKASELVELCDGILISRHELALTVEPSTVPMICKEVIRLCNEQAKSVYIASEMLASMRQNATPTRAEVSDLANAIMDGTDAIVLSEDITQGPNQKRAVELTQEIISDVETHSMGDDANWNKEAFEIKNEFDAVSYHAYQTARRVGAKAVVCITHAGNTALRLASFHPEMPIYAVTFSSMVARQLRLVRGVVPLLLEGTPSLDDVLPVVSDRLKREEHLSLGDRIVFVTVSLSPVGAKASNLFTIQKLE